MKILLFLRKYFFLVLITVTGSIGIFFLYPSSSSLGSMYLHFVLKADKDSILSLGNAECGHFLSDDADTHIKMFQGKVIRNKKVTVENSRGSDDDIQIVQLNFEYADEDKGPWQPGEITLLTTLTQARQRFVCESLDFHGP